MVSRETLWAEEFMQQRLREAEHERLIRQIRSSGRGQRRSYRHALAAVGHRLVQWGTYLQSHYGETRRLVIDPVTK